MAIARHRNRSQLPACLVAAALLTACGDQTPSSVAGTAPPSSGAPSQPSTSEQPGGAGRWVPAGTVPGSDPAFGGPVWPTLVALADGRALVVGSDNRCRPGGPVFGDAHTSGLFDPATDSWTATGALNKDRGFFTAVALPDGRVLVTGGANSIENGELSFSSTKLWAAASGAWRDGGLLSHARTGAFGTVLPDGRVLVGGGYYFDGRAPQRALSSAEVYDIEQDRWTDVPSMPSTLEDARAVTLADGRALAMGTAPTGSGAVTWQALVFDPANDTWEDVPEPPEDARGALELVALTDGDAIALLDHPYRFDGAAGTWELLGLDRNVSGAQAARLPDGRVMVAGGQAPEPVGDPDTWPALDRVDVYDPEADTFTPLAAMPDGRQDGDLAVLADGSAIYAAGASAANPTSTPGCPSPRSDAVRYLPG